MLYNMDERLRMCEKSSNFAPFFNLNTMRKVLLFIFTIISLSTFATDWSSVEWLKNGSGDEKNTDKYKIDAAFGQNVVDIQQPAWATEAGIYSYFLAAVESCSGIPEGKYKIEGAGIILYLTAFTQKETKVTISAGGSEFECTVYYADGEGEVSTDPEPGKPENPDVQSATYKSQSEADIAGNKVLFDWSITYNADKTLTFELTWPQAIEGIVPQISVNKGDITIMPTAGQKAVYTTKETFEKGAALEAFFYIAYPGNAARIDIVGYKVGDSTVEPEDPEQPSDPEPDPEPEPEPDPDPEQPENPEQPEDPGSSDPETPGTDPETPENPETPEEPGDEGVDAVTNGQLPVSHKIIENGVLYVESNGIRYTATGAIVR